MSRPSPAPARTATADPADLVRDDRLRFRDRLHPTYGKAQQYSESMLDYGGWGEFPPATVVELTAPHRWTEETTDVKYASQKKTVEREYPAGSLVLVGGYTRCEALALAAASEGIPDTFDSRVPCKVTPGTWADALHLAWKENAHHGQPRSSDEVAAVLASIHAQAGNWELGRRQVAAMSGVSPATVDRWRQRNRPGGERLTEPPPKPKAPAEVPPSGPPDAEPEEPAELPEQFEQQAAAAMKAIKDAWGRPVPPWVEMMFGAGTAAIKVAAKEIRSACLRLAAAKHGPDGKEACLDPALSLVDLQSVAAAAYTAADLLDNGYPYLVCPRCDGHGSERERQCKLCRGAGVLTRPQADALSGPDQQRATAHREAL